jgi:2-polyprenyl-6-methoxyphenol hydroxylase-like FAD-dependent oxidoreductase
MTEHAVVIAGGGPTGLMLAGELALAGVDVAIVERRASQDLIGSRAGGLHSRTIEVLDQRGIADRFLSHGKVAQVAGFAWIPLDISDFPTRHNYGLALWQSHIERVLAGCDGGGSLIRKAAGIEFPGWDPTTSHLIADGQIIASEASFDRPVVCCSDTLGRTPPSAPPPPAERAPLP